MQYLFLPLMKVDTIFSIKTKADFEDKCLAVFNFQYINNKVYQQYCNLLGKPKSAVKQISDIPFLPIEFFKKQKVVSNKFPAQKIFTSSGTTGATTSKHYVTNISIYEKSYVKGFHYFYGSITDYCVLALLPSYLEREGSSLIYMADDLIKKSTHPKSNFYLNNLDELIATIEALEKQNQKILLIGVSFALLDLVEKHSFQLKNTLIMETGGMKGKRKEMTRHELHTILKKGFGVENIHSEYGMTELLSQAYSKGNGIFECPPWMQICLRNTENPLEPIHALHKTGGINVIDLANINSCSFIATQDLGKLHHDNTFEVLGRFDHSDIRGCNLMVL